jgi:hypothetical protein
MKLQCLGASGPDTESNSARVIHGSKTTNNHNDATGRQELSDATLVLY